MPVLIACGVDPSIAIVTVFTGFFPATILKSVLMARMDGVIPWRGACSSGVAAAVGSAIGGMFVSSAPTTLLKLVIGGMALFFGLLDTLNLCTKSARKAEATAWLQVQLEFRQGPGRMPEGPVIAARAEHRQVVTMQGQYTPHQRSLVALHEIQQ